MSQRAFLLWGFLGWSWCPISHVNLGVNLSGSIKELIGVFTWDRLKFISSTARTDWGMPAHPVPQRGAPPALTWALCLSGLALHVSGSM